MSVAARRLWDLPVPRASGVHMTGITKALEKPLALEVLAKA
jgi:hypothetical protein